MGLGCRWIRRATGLLPLHAGAVAHPGMAARVFSTPNDYFDSDEVAESVKNLEIPEIPEIQPVMLTFRTQHQPVKNMYPTFSKHTEFSLHGSDIFVVCFDPKLG